MPRYLEDADVVAERVKRFGEVFEPGVDVSEFPTSVTTPRVTEEMPKSVAAKVKRFGEVIEPGVPVSEYPTSVTGPVVKEPDDKPDDKPDDEPDDKPIDKPTVFPKAGTILRYKPGRTGFRIPVIADGKGGETDGAEVADPGYQDPNLSGDGEFEFVGYDFNADFTQRRAKKFNKKTGQFSYDPFEPNPMSKEQFDKINAQKIQDARDLAEKRDSYKLLETTMRSYGFTESELQEVLNYMQKGLTDPNMGPNQMLLDLRNLKSYQARFAGNEERRGRGLNALSEADYLQQEKDFSDTLRQYGVQRFATRGQFATFIGNAVSNAEVGRRAKIAVERLQMGDPAILKQFRIYYPNITDSDIVSYFLNPKEVLPELEAKTTTSEIGATAKQYGLNADLTRASELQRYGVDLAEARVGYQAISERLPRGQELSKIYKESGIDYSQDVAEEEQYKGTASAKRAREKLYGLEAASFSKETGLTPVSLTSRRSGAY